MRWHDWTLLVRPIWLAILVAGTLSGCGEPSPEPSSPPDPAGASFREPASSAATGSPEATQAPAAPSVRPVFDNVAQESGVDFTYDRDVVEGRWLIVEVMGGGVAWLDADLDGWLDLFVTNGGPIDPATSAPRASTDQYFRSLGPNASGKVHFVKATQSAGIPDSGYAQGVAVGDYDADGFPDIAITAFGPNVLLHNNGDGTFTDVTAEAGIADAAWGTGAAFADLNSDGLLDLYVANFLDQSLENVRQCEYGGVIGYCGPGQYKGVQDAVFLGNGDGTFREASHQLGFTEPPGMGKGLCVVIADMDNDLAAEVYVGNDMTPNFLYTRGTSGSQTQNDREVRFREIGIPSGCGLSDQGENEASMGVVCEDLDDDGLPDLFLCHFYKAKNTLYHNLGRLQFLDASRRSKIAVTSFNNLGFGTVALDWDRDGFLDLFNATGNVLGPHQPPEHMPPQLLRRIDQTRFEDVSSAVDNDYFAGEWLGRGVAGGDYDNDGDLDIAVSHNDSPLALLENDTATPRGFLGIELVTPDRIPPIGGRVEVVSGPIKMIRPVVAGGSYLASHDPRMLFTTESMNATAEVTVYWPNGEVQKETLSGGRYWRISSGQPPMPLNSPRQMAGDLR